MTESQRRSVEKQGPRQPNKNEDIPYHHKPRSVPAPREELSARRPNNTNYAALPDSARPVTFSLFQKPEAPESVYGTSSSGHAGHAQSTTDATNVGRRSGDYRSSYRGAVRHGPDVVIEPGLSRRPGSAETPRPTATTLRNESSTTHGGTASSNSSHLSELGQRFIRIAWADYKACEDFMAGSPEILKESLDRYQLEASRLQGDSKFSQARTCVQQLLLLRKASQMTQDQSQNFFRRLTSTGQANSTLKSFLEDFDTTLRAIQAKAASAPGHFGSETANRRQKDLSSGGRYAPEHPHQHSTDTDLSVPAMNPSASIPHHQEQNRGLRKDGDDNSRPPTVRRSSHLERQLQGLSSVDENVHTNSLVNTQSEVPPGAPSVDIPDIQGDGEYQDTLDERYFVRRNAQCFFTLGRIFAMLWHENAGALPKGSQLSNKEHFRPFKTGIYREQIHSHILRLAVVRERQGYCWCIPINTYSGRGLLKPGFHHQDYDAHAVIHMDDVLPYASREEAQLMIKQPIAVHAANLGQKLKEMSRINFGRPYSVQWNVKVMNVGKVAADSMPRFESYWRNEISGT